MFGQSEVNAMLVKRAITACPTPGQEPALERAADHISALSPDEVRQVVLGMLNIVRIMARDWHPVL